MKIEPIKYRRDVWKAIMVEGNAVEVGVAEGFFSADILRMPVHFPKVYMVDRWKRVAGMTGDSANLQLWHDKNLEAARKRVAEFGDRAVILQGDSVVMANHIPDFSLSLAYIDGDHSYEGVKADIKAWLPKVKHGGVMAFHDYRAPQYGVARAVNEFAKAKGIVIHQLLEEKDEDAGAFFIC